MVEVFCDGFGGVGSFRYTDVVEVVVVLIVLVENVGVVVWIGDRIFVVVAPIVEGTGTSSPLQPSKKMNDR